MANPKQARKSSNATATESPAPRVSVVDDTRIGIALHATYQMDSLFDAAQVQASRINNGDDAEDGCGGHPGARDSWRRVGKRRHASSRRAGSVVRAEIKTLESTIRGREVQDLTSRRRQAPLRRGFS